MAALELHDLSKRYGDTVALDGLGFTVEGGQVFGFVGPNGAGKTTAMRIVIGVLEPDAGHVQWNGTRLDTGTRRRFGYMPEERGLYPKMRVGDQLAFFGTLHGLDDEQARANAERWTERLGIAERADDKVEELSLGNQQRVQLAAALVHDPDLLVLDEPFSGLDPVGVDVLSEVLLDVARERDVPVIFSSHQLELVERLCDAVAIIAAGRLVASGEVAELRARARRAAGGGSRSRRRSRLGRRGPGVRPVPGEPSVYELAEEADPQALLEAARGAGEVAALRARGSDARRTSSATS